MVKLTQKYESFIDVWVQYEKKGGISLTKRKNPLIFIVLGYRKFEVSILNRQRGEFAIPGIKI